MAQEATMNYSSSPKRANLEFLPSSWQVCTCKVEQTEALQASKSSGRRQTQLTREVGNPEDQSHRRWRREGTGLICLPITLLSRNQNMSHSLILRGPISKESAAINTVFLFQWKIVSGCLWAVCPMWGWLSALGDSQGDAEQDVLVPSEARLTGEGTLF